MNASPTPKSAHSVIHKGLFTHHAYLIVGGQPEYENIHALIEKEFDINSAGNADFFDRSYGSFTIDDAREVKSAHSMKPLSHEALKIFILRMDAITTEAQNALLKLLEEPASYAKFFLILPSAHLLLLTVRSRLASASKTSSIHSKKDERDLGAARKFIKSSVSERLKIVSNMVSAISKEKMTRREAIDFMEDVELSVYEDLGVEKGKSFLKAIEVARKYANDRAPSMKMLLEFLAISH